MDLDKIQRLLEIVAESGLDEVKVEEGDFKLTVRATPKQDSSAAASPSIVMTAPAVAPAAPASAGPSAPAPAAPAASVAAPSAEPGSGANEELVLAPIVGTFYASPAPDADPFVKVGDRVEVGQTLCIIEAMKLMNEIQAEEAGTVSQILVSDAEPVEFDQPLFVLDK